LAYFPKILINSKSKSCVYVSEVNKWKPVNIANTGIKKNDAAMNGVFLLQPQGMNAAADPQDVFSTIPAIKPETTGIIYFP